VNRALRLALLAAASVLVACGHRLPPSLELRATEDRGVIFGRLAPLANVQKGVVELRRADKSVLKAGLDPDGYWVVKAAPGALRLAAFSYRQGDKLHAVTLNAPPAFEVKAGVACYVGLVVISPITQDAYLTDDFVRDRAWFASTFGDALKPVSSFANQYFYELMRRFGETPAPPEQVEGGRARIAGAKFLMGDVWPGGGVSGPGGADQTQIPPREVAVSAFQIDQWPVSAADEAAPGAVVVAAASWSEAERICRNRGGRLPTEAEWELAARGPRWGARYYGGAPLASAGKAVGEGERPVVGDVSKWTRSLYGVFFDGQTTPEWTNDWFGARAAAGQDPAGPASGREKVLRAGPYRFAVSPEIKSNAIGFRCVYGGAELKPAAEPETKPAATVPPAPTEPNVGGGGPIERRTIAVRSDADVFAGPSPQSAVIARVLGGQLVTWLGESGEFVCVRLDNGDEGFVRKRDLAVNSGEER
jgi:formylglycine-generating enzyme required for sulfatase activity